MAVGKEQIKGEKTVIFEPKTEQEIIDSKLWPKGEYAFEIVGGLGEKQQGVRQADD